ncbi:RNA polymerase sigma factor [Streptomyces sp. PSKA30]|uniref:RNA polymerase sigma factor n=1 Tax=Streptomyces sp. PSKA30 TaxID=2874597 RepID=UPI001CD11CEA|nr:sigma-70 family RNA polymerase sigma factor [Streptomyces sp. PSKA30]MBZ9643598.1 sigma-70 family RNA polymerase sigma factor [Streptomyces sp. PSKA30]
MSTHESAGSEWQRLWSHREALLKVARRRSVSIEDAEDAVQEAMVRAVENPEVDRERLGAWLTSVTVRLCVDRHRQLNRDAALGLRARSVLTGPHIGSPEATVCDRAEAQWLALQSTALPRRQAEALHLKAQDLDVTQVAQRMGLTYKATESLLGRARQTLRAALATTLALVMGLWRGRPRVDGGSSAAAPATALASAGVAVAIAGFALVAPAEVEGPPVPRPSLSGPADTAASLPLDEAGSAKADEGANAAEPAGPGMPEGVRSAGATGGAVPAEAAPGQGTDGGPAGAPSGPQPAAGLPALPEAPAPDLPVVPEAPAAGLPPLPGAPSGDLSADPALPALSAVPVPSEEPVPLLLS